MGIETLSIPKNTFNHGKTREWARQQKKTDISIFLTQDAFPTPKTLPLLLQPLLKNQAQISYARQIPRKNAPPLEAFPRIFNYPPISHLRTFADREKYGFYTLFCSNSCAAYCNQSLDAIGGFPQTPFGEDTLATAKILQQGGTIAYVAEALVTHSHPPSLQKDWQRYKIIGALHQQNQSLFSPYTTPSSRGKKYVQSLLSSLWKTSPHLIPYALLQSATKFIAYHAGRMQ